MQVCVDLQILSAVTTLVKLFAIFDALLIPCWWRHHLANLVKNKKANRQAIRHFCEWDFLKNPKGVLSVDASQRRRV